MNDDFNIVNTANNTKGKIFFFIIFVFPVYPDQFLRVVNRLT
jgi:hypothetical protein